MTPDPKFGNCEEALRALEGPGGLPEAVCRDFRAIRQVALCHAWHRGDPRDFEQAVERGWEAVQVSCGTTQGVQPTSTVNEIGRPPPTLDSHPELGVQLEQEARSTDGAADPGVEVSQPMRQEGPNTCSPENPRPCVVATAVGMASGLLEQNGKSGEYFRELAQGGDYQDKELEYAFEQFRVDAQAFPPEDRDIAEFLYCQVLPKKCEEPAGGLMKGDD